MKKTIKKTLAMLLVLAMMFSLAACSKNNDGGNNSGDGNKVTDTPNTPDATDAPQQGDDADKTLADYDKVSSFNYYGIASGISDGEFNALATVDMVKEHTGYDVAYFQAPADAADRQTGINNIFMLKQDYQAVKVSKDEFYTLLAMDALKPITEYVNASTNLKEQISEFGWDTASKDGEIYGVPQKNALACTNVGIAYRIDWLEEYNAANPGSAIPVPSEENGYSMSVSDYKAMLTYFATKVPEGGYAMGIDVDGVYLENILPAFGIYQDWAEVDGKLTYVVNQPGFADYVAYMEDLFDSGLIMYQATSNDTSGISALQQRMVGAARIAHWNAFAVETTSAPEGVEASTYTDDSIGYISALVPDDCKGDASKVRVYAEEGYSYYTVIPNYTTDEQTAAVIDFIDKKLEKDFFLQLVLGTEGTTYRVENGEYYPILPEFDNAQGQADKFMDGTREDDYSSYWLCRVKKSAAQHKMFSQSNYNIANTGIQNPIKVMPPNEVYDTYYSAANNETKSALVTTMYKTGVTCNVADIQAKFNEYSGAEIEESVNSWYTTWEMKDSFNSVKPR